MGLDDYLGDYLGYYRKKKLGFSQSKFAETLNKYQEDISQIENGKKSVEIHELLILAEEYNNPLLKVIAYGLKTMELKDLLNRIA